MTTHRLGARAGHRAPGWYPDPATAGRITAEPRFRWWDGSAWTGWQSASPHAPMPHGQAPRQSADDSLHWTRRHTGRLVVGVLVLVLLVMTVAGMRAVAHRPGPGIAAPTTGAEPPVALAVADDDTITLYDAVHLTPPSGVQWETAQQQTLAGSFSRYQLGGTVVGDDRVAIWVAAVLSPDLAGADPQRTAAAATQRWRERATGTYALASTTEPRVDADPSRPGALLGTFDSTSSARPGATAQHRVLVVPVPSAATANNPHPVAVVITMIPDRTPPDARAELDRLMESVRVDG